jgi:transposase
MAIVVGLDVHRSQITYDALNTATGEVMTGRIAPADRATLRAFLAGWADEDVEAAVEATTGWRFVVEELQRAGAAGSAGRAGRHDRGARPEAARQDRQARRPPLTRPADRAAAAAGVDRARTHPRAARPRAAAQDARRPAHRVGPPRRPRRARATARAGPLAGRAATDDRRAGDHRARQLAAGSARSRPQGVRARPAGMPGVDASLRHRSAGGVRDPGRARRHPPLLLVAPVGRFAGLDVTVHESDAKRRAGHLSRQGPPVLRWAAFEAAESACKPASPDYLELNQRVGANRAVLSVARKLLRRAHHTLRELGDDALAPAA